MLFRLFVANLYSTLMTKRIFEKFHWWTVSWAGR